MKYTITGKKLINETLLITTQKKQRHIVDNAGAIATSVLHHLDKLIDELKQDDRFEFTWQFKKI